METQIDYWSYSSMSSFLSNQLAFKKKYLLKIYDDLTSPSALVGSAGHKALEDFFKGMSQEDAIASGATVIRDKSDVGIDYGKTGTREKINKTYTQAINFYFQEFQMPHKVLSVEEAIVEEATDDQGQKFPLPMKAKIDLITRNKLSELEIIDHKFVSSYSDGDTLNFKHWIQAMFNYYTVLAKYGEAPARIIFNECKTSKNSGVNAGKPQIQPYVYNYDSPAHFAAFFKLYNACTNELNLPGKQFLPNPNDMFDGQNSFDTFLLGVMGTERPVEVSYKKEVKLYGEKNFMPSSTDTVEGQNFTPQEHIRLKFQEFGIYVESDETHVGPSVTLYTFKPGRGTRMSAIEKMGNDIALALKAQSVRIQAPIRGTNVIGVEVPSLERKTIELAESHLVRGSTSIPIGIDVYGELVRQDITDAPHMLIAGQTGSGKSVMINSILQSLTKQLTPSQLKLILIDPKQVELASFEKLDHLLHPVEHELEGSVRLVDEVIRMMELRYKKLAGAGVRNITEYNKLQGKKKLPLVVMVIDEFADLMLAGGKKKRVFQDVVGHNSKGTPILKRREEASVESMIIRIAQKARAVGIHLILATQRPSVDVVTGLIKANIPTKIAFSTTSAVNSQVILDQDGAEELTGKGDMLFVQPNSGKVQRLQGLYA